MVEARTRIAMTPRSTTLRARNSREVRAKDQAKPPAARPSTTTAMARRPVPVMERYRWAAESA